MPENEEYKRYNFMGSRPNCSRGQQLSNKSLHEKAMNFMGKSKTQETEALTPWPVTKISDRQN